jgi:hypothetical protein
MRRIIYNHDFVNVRKALKYLIKDSLDRPLFIESRHYKAQAVVVHEREEVSLERISLGAKEFLWPL